MAITKMNRLRMIAMRADRDSLLHELMLLGCVHITEAEPLSADGGTEDGSPGFPRLARGTADTGAAGAQLHSLESALALVEKYDKSKKKLFAPPTAVSADELFSDEAFGRALMQADEINSLESDMNLMYAEKSRVEALRAQLAPWTSLDVPLDLPDTASVVFSLGTIPGQTQLDDISAKLAESAPACELITASSSREQHCVLLVCHRSDYDAAMQLLRQYGFAKAAFGIRGKTAAEALADAEERLYAIEDGIETVRTMLGSYASAREPLKLACDRAELEKEKKQAASSLAETGSSFLLEGWVPVPAREPLEKLLGGFCCAWEFSEPEPGDDVPVALKNNKLTEPMMMVTEMYSLPLYTNTDPNPLIMPFFSIFFGIMYADIGYGAVLALIGIIIKKCFKPRRTMKHMSGLAILCGITSIIFGVLFGSCFGDAVPVITGMFGKPVQLWTLINPLDDPMTILIGSLILGFIQIIFGMGVKAYLLIRDGHPLDALFDIGSWWLLFAGIGVGALGGGWYVAIAGVLALLLTQGRSKPTIMGKIIGGVSSLYDVTSYFGDILSYSRLMALLLATCVIASVINTLGSLTGFLYPIIFLVGHGFNMAINVIGTFVHSARLQYLEFFKTFYEDGGKPFAPLSLDSTKYVYVTKEDK